MGIRIEEGGGQRSHNKSGSMAPGASQTVTPNTKRDKSESKEGSDVSGWM